MSSAIPDDTLDRLVAMSRGLGDPANDYVILGEGNTSARHDAETFWVKASGSELRTCLWPLLIRFQTCPTILRSWPTTTSPSSTTPRWAGG